LSDPSETGGSGFVFKKNKDLFDSIALWVAENASQLEKQSPE